jgi:hypothetical protein
MKNIPLILFVVLFAAISSATDKPAPPAVPLRDGFVLSGTEGTITKDPDADTWYFAPTNDIIDIQGAINARQKVQFLPSSALEKIVANLEGKDSLNIRLWARITRYCNRNTLLNDLPSRKFANRKIENTRNLDAKFLNENLYNKNYLFAVYFLPLTDVPAPAPDTQKTSPDKKDTPSDSILPEGVLEQLTPKRVVNLAGIKEAMTTKTDVVLADRTGLVTIDDEHRTFEIDGLGRNLDDISFELLPCEALESTEKSLLTASLIRQRFRISGIITTYKGKQYMLMQRSTRTYSHGNFAR